MLAALGCASMDGLVNETVPEAIRLEQAIVLPAARSESGALDELRGNRKEYFW